MNMFRMLLVSLGCVVVLLIGSRAQELKGNAKVVDELAAASEVGKDITKQAVVLKGRFKETGVAMKIYGTRSQGGIGYGSKGVRIERKLIEIDEDGIDDATLKQENKELLRLSHINLVMAEILRGFAPEKPFLGRGKKEWLRDIEALKSASTELASAVRKNDPRAVQNAVKKINQACDSCHDGTR